MDDQPSGSDNVSVRQVMTSNPIVVSPEVTIERVMALMQEASIRHVPVVDDDGILGMISNRDLSFIHSIPGVMKGVDEADVQKVLDAPVSVVMKSRFLVDRDVVTIGRDEPLTRAVDIFVASKLGALPVVDDTGGVVGILSAVDVLRWVGDDVL